MIDSRPNTENYTYYDRALSWLSFNYRVLEEASDKNLPLCERIKFLAIHQSNLDKFFRTGVTAYKVMTHLPKSTLLKVEPNLKKTIQLIELEVKRQLSIFEKIFNELILFELPKNNIYILKPNDVSIEQANFLKQYFTNEVLPLLQPIILKKDEVSNSLQDNIPYFAIRLHKTKNLSQGNEKLFIKEAFAIVKIPTDKLARFVILSPSNGCNYVMFIDDVIKIFSGLLFPLYTVDSVFSIISSRNLKLKIEDEFKRKHAKKMLKKLAEKKQGIPPRFIYDRNMPEDFLMVIKNAFSLSDKDMESGYNLLNLSDLHKFPCFDQKSVAVPMLPLNHIHINKHNGFFKAIKHRDYILHFPYQSFDSIIRFFNEAAIDPKVEEIKTTQYKLENNTAIVSSLISAALNGKKVSVYVDFKARFNEAHNQRFIDQLIEAGIHIEPSTQGLKIHAKAALIIRKTTDKLKKRKFAYLSTGNFNEKTAQMYSDHGYFTSKKSITEDLHKIFDFMEKPEGILSLNELIIPKFNMRESLKNLIDCEIQNTGYGNGGHIILKMNNLEDKRIIDMLYQASQAGVKIDLIVRAICCLVPGKSFSKNIRVIRIVDKYLEHSRIFAFRNGGDYKVFISSADLMKPNLSRRLDIIVPITDVELKLELLQLLKIQLADNTKAKLLGKDLSDWHLSNLNEPKIQSQIEIYNYLKTLNE